MVQSGRKMQLKIFTVQFLLRSITKSCMTVHVARDHFEIPARDKRDPILNNYLTQTKENNARSDVRRVQAEMSFIFVFPSVVRIEKTCVVF